MGVSFPVIANDSMALLLTPMLGVGFEYTSPDGPMPYTRKSLRSYPP